MAQSKPNDKNLELNDADFDLTNSICHKSASLGLELVDHIIISNLSIKSKKPLYYSYTEHALIEFISQDITYKTVNESREEIVEFTELSKKEINKINTDMRIDLVKNMLATNVDINFIMKHTGLIIEEIKKIKHGMNK